MAEPFIGEVRIFAGNFAPRGWAFCNGQLLPINQYTALFSLVGTTYGGDGRTTMGLPNLQGRFPMHPGRGPGLTPRNLGQRGGATTVALTEAQMPDHSHAVQFGTEEALDRDPASALPARPSGELYRPGGTDAGAMTLVSRGGGQTHENRPPWLCINYIIALQGTYPSRS